MSYESLKGTITIVFGFSGLEDGWTFGQLTSALNQIRRCHADCSVVKYESKAWQSVRQLSLVTALLLGRLWRRFFGFLIFSELGLMSFGPIFQLWRIIF